METTFKFREGTCRRENYEEITVVLNTAASKEELVIEAVRKAVPCNGGVRPGNNVIKAPDAPVFIVETDSEYFFVKTLDFRKFKVYKKNESMCSFSYDKRGEFIKAHMEGGMIVFWKVSNFSGERISSYRYIEL